jgi:hypothetical protein
MKVPIKTTQSTAHRRVAVIVRLPFDRR